MLKSVLIDNSYSELDKIDKINNDSFLKEAQLPTSFFPELAKSGFIFPYAFYDDDKLVAFTIVAYTYEMMYFAYLAVDKSQRSKGIGSKIFDYYKSKMKAEGKDILFCSEALDSSANNYKQRVARISFHKRNGFYIVGDKAVMNGIEYVYMSNNPLLDKKTINKELNKIITLCTWFADAYPQMAFLKTFSL